ncbi:MAG: hypothetical protein HQL78_14315 [Magnetococcales bacterium]|nr:hypothetical protein [Magnetococcales bacterium]
MIIQPDAFDMAKQTTKIPQDLVDWIAARKRFRLSHAQIQMARELGMNPKKLGKLANHKQEPWKAPLPEFIEDVYFKRFKRDKPNQIRTIEEIAAARRGKKVAKQTAQSNTPPVEHPPAVEDRLEPLPIPGSPT